MKIQNKTSNNYQRYMEGKWAFGEDAQDEVEAEAETDEDDVENAIT